MKNFLVSVNDPKCVMINMINEQLFIYHVYHVYHNTFWIIDGNQINFSSKDVYGATLLIIPCKFIWGHDIMLVFVNQMYNRHSPWTWWRLSILENSSGSLLLREINSLWPSGAIWRQGSRSTLVQVKACCLTAPSHYLNQCRLTITKVQWCSSEGNFTWDITQPSVTKISLKIIF